MPPTGTPVCVGSNSNGTWALIGGTWTYIGEGFYRVFAAFGHTGDRLFFPQSVDNSIDGGSWTISRGAFDSGDPTTGIDLDTHTPTGTYMCTHKNRVWVAGDPDEPSRLYYSKISPNGNNNDWYEADPDDITQDSAGNLLVSPGDGQSITGIVEYQDAIIIFKDDSTHIFNYDDYVGRGQLVQISNSTGCYGIGGIALYQGVLIVYHRGKVYAFSNGSFSQLNTKFRLESDFSYSIIYPDPVYMSVVGDHLVIRHYDRIYVHSLITGGWMEWETDAPVENFVQKPSFIDDEVQEYLISSGRPEVDEIYEMRLDWTPDVEEDFECSVKTKILQYNSPQSFKRLFWWGIDAVTNLSVSGRATPIVLSFSPSWGALLAFIWDDFLNNTWGHLLSANPSVVTPAITSTFGNQRRMFKFLEGLRFRQIEFEVIMTSDGTSTNGPQKLISVVPFVNIKETVTRQVS